MKNFYMALVALGLALGASAQNINYNLDSTFNGVGSKIYTSEFPNATLRSCYLNLDGSMLVAGQSDGSIPNTRYAAKIASNGNVTSDLCNSVCMDTVGISFYTNIYKLSNNFYFSSTGYGGDALISNASSLDKQVYDNNLIVSNANIQFDANHIIQAASGQGQIYAYTANNVGGGYAGAPGIINGASYSHGGIIPSIPESFTNANQLNVLGVQANKSILVGGSTTVVSSNQSEPFIARYKPNSLVTDSAFGTNGIVKLSLSTGEVTAMILDANDNIFACYTAGGSSYLAILNPNGSFNTSAVSGGNILLSSNVYNMFFTHQDKILLAFSGDETIAALYSYDDNGSANTTFNNGSNKMLFADILPDFTFFNVNDIEADVYGNLAISGYSKINNGSNWNGTIVRLKTLQPATPASVSEVNKASLNIYPNPSSDVITFDNIELSSKASVKIFSLDGKVLKNVKVENNKINIESLSSGIFLIVLNDGDKVYRSKFSKL